VFIIIIINYYCYYYSCVMVFYIITFVASAVSAWNILGRGKENPFSCVCLHGDRRPQERKENLEKFKVFVRFCKMGLSCLLVTLVPGFDSA